MSSFQPALNVISEEDHFATQMSNPNLFKNIESNVNLTDADLKIKQALAHPFKASDLVRVADKTDPNVTKSQLILEKASKYNTNFAFKPNLREKRRRQIKDQIRKAKDPSFAWPDLSQYDIVLDRISDKFIKKDLNQKPKPLSANTNVKGDKVFQSKKLDQYHLVAEDNIEVKFKDQEEGTIPHIEMLNKETLNKDTTFKNIMEDKFDTKIEGMARKQRIATEDLKDYLTHQQVQKDPFKFVDEESFNSLKESRWVNRFCKKNGVKMNIQLLKDEKRRKLQENSNFQKQNEIQFLNINGKIAKMDYEKYKVYKSGK